MKTRKILFYIFLALSVAVNIFIVIEGATSGSESESQSFGFTAWFIDVVRNIDPESGIVQNPETTHAVIRKLVGHFGLFGLSGILSTLMFLFINDSMTRKIQIIICTSMYGFFFALVSELAQYFTPGRYMSFIDVLIDFSGYILFSGLTFLIYYFIYKHKEKKA